LYVADTDNQLLRKVSSTGSVTTIGGTGTVGSSDGSGTAAGFHNPMDIAIDPSGNLIVVDRGNKVIRKGSLASTSASSNATADCVFNWAERSFAQYFSPAASSATAAPFYYRYYAAKQTAIGFSSSDNSLYVLFNGQLSNLGLLSTWSAQAACP